MPFIFERGSYLAHHKVLPVIQSEATLTPVYQRFLKALKASPFQGDIDASYGGRLVASTDNSIYQQMPQAVIYPKTQDDVGIVTHLAAQAEHQGVCFSPRGGGTGTNGQSLTEWLVLDLSRYLTRVLEINEREGWVRVETGIVKDALNEALKPYGYFFAPDTSTSNRCTLGGMINTDASGQGSLVYGKTSDHILALASYTMHGQRLETKPVDLTHARKLAELGTVESSLYQQAIKSCVDLRGRVVEKFPALNRFLTGYDLKHCYDADNDQIDLSRLIAGSEGTLAVVTEAKLNITRIPRHKVLVNVKYSDFQSALKHAPALVRAQATSVETIDSKVLNLARQDIVWQGVKDLLQDDAEVAMDGINMVEFTATSQHALCKKLSQLEAQLDDDMRSDSGVLGYQVCDDAASIQRIYAMRKKAVGLLGATKGKRKPIAFAEDTAVPPESLADFITEFRALLDSHQLHYGMFGHVDAGVLHVRPALDMQDEIDERLVRTISDEVVALTAKYGGLMWGEHGKGYRSEYGPEFFGDQLFTELRKIKSAFDPLNRLNPGKICTPYNDASHKDGLVSVDARKRGWFDRQIPVATQQRYQTAMDCNGNGLCFNFDASSAMCPSYRVTGDRRYSPKGRAALLREWLRRQEGLGYDVSHGPKRSLSWWGKRRSAKQLDDFNHEVKASMDECLACKACSSQCPVKVDIPRHRANFMAHYHSRYPRPLKDYVVKNVERWLPRMAKHARLVNCVSQSAAARGIAAKWLGYEDMPALSVPPLYQRDLYNKAMTFAQFKKHREGQSLGDAERGHYVGLVPDPFTMFYEADLVEDFIKLAGRLGVQLVMMPYQPNGKAAHVKGFLDEFADMASAQADVLNQAAAMELPLVGLDASTVLCFDDEYRQVLGEKRGAFRVKLVQQWLLEDIDAEVLGDFVRVEPTGYEKARPVQLFLHCTEQTAVGSSAQDWQQVFAKVGIACQSAAVGCCGMAGTYGHESEHQNNSKALFAMSWQPQLNQAEQPLASGFSCRCQTSRITGSELMHPLQHLLKALC